MSVLTFVNVFNVIVGGLIGAFAPSWLWVVVVPFVIGFGMNVLGDYWTYEKPFLHMQAAAIDSIGFLIFAVFAFLLRLLYKRERDKRTSDQGAQKD